jgi:putative endonuclease
VDRQPAVYILASKPYGTLYIGVTSDLVRRIWEHRSDLVDGFSRRHGWHQLVYFEQHGNIIEAIQREKQMKKWNRAWKIQLIEAQNPGWQDQRSMIVGET